MTVDLTAVPWHFNPKFRPLVYDDHRIHVLVGGASSGKSYDTALKIIYRMVSEPGHRYLVVRKVAKTIRHSCYDLLCLIIEKWEMQRLFERNDSSLSLRCKINGNDLLSSGLDDVEKLKSIQGITDIWVEEASDITKDDFVQLNLRLRGKSTHKKQITLTLNPVSALHWIKAEFFDRQAPDALTHHSTYLDNLFLDADAKRMLESIEPGYHRDVYVLGVWGVFGNVVFTNFVIEEFEYEPEDFENVCAGMDFGYVHASALMRCGFRDGELYIFDELYGKGWTNADFIKAAIDYFGDVIYRMDITADSSEPARIEEWNRAGIPVYGAKKEQGSLGYGIDFLSGRRIHIHATRCPRAAQEFPVFQRKQDKDGNVLENKYVEVNDDTIAAVRYATEYIWSQQNAMVPEWAAADLGL